ncbi:fumarylacetoacetate hydrolase family protein [Cytobacillus firmus]|uniref:fumarylacetoacetate hydrolase family protein n=1 Tax=Cytobacillus firmus TaxID=1399 RepID=UPI00157FFDB4|nr:fumarylacetoacetate hydrolase family protein [Cytobacillus firmus]MBY6051057.1 fumarylacetoacetate hydrolase family protein [Cytobacillus firmus]NUH82809.1 fumarylacetoacetate hydrolase family protein [Cytobacillus firmus]USK38069.1 fumarylacetoacetate hydrolase family protein [Cytobacillus firmus]WHY33238.1 fumarylacetoacetate hydrolase family protein [Cytobacillus firmus]
MRLATIQINGKEQTAVITKNGAIPIESINKNYNQNFEINFLNILSNGQLEDLKLWVETNSQELDASELAVKNNELKYSPLYRHPRKIWGIGLNYVEHASDLSEKAPNTEPASFMKPDTSIIGPDDTISIPLQSERTTAEAELGIIIGKECKNVAEEDAPSVVAGFTTIIDMTAEDILQRNPRYLTRSKSFDSFFSFGPQFVSTDEVENVLELNVSTVINGKIHRKNTVANMTFRPWDLVSFHSKVMTLLPGDIISTGTPGAVVIRNGDIVECHIDGFEPLVNPVKDLKVKSKTEEQQFA